MTQIWKGDVMIAVTKIQAGPCPVLQVKTKAKEGYDSVQIGFGEKKEKNIARPQVGHFKKAQARKDIKHVREFRETKAKVAPIVANIGDVITVDTFQTGDTIKIVGTSKGRGFQGVVKRHGFSGQNATHGHKDQERMPGSIGATDAQRVLKGMRMGGHMGTDRVTITNTEIIEIEKENNILYIKGGVPGARNSLIMISGDGELKVESQKSQKAESPKEEKIEEEIKEAEVAEAEIVAPTAEAAQ